LTYFRFPGGRERRGGKGQDCYFLSSVDLDLGVERGEGKKKKKNKNDTTPCSSLTGIVKVYSKKTTEYNRSKMQYSEVGQ
jgi:hypothetical protein